MVPVAQHAQAFKIFSLPVDLGAGIIAAFVAEGFHVHFLAGLTDFFLHVQLDGQTVAIPAGHVRGIVAVQRAALDDDVLQHLVNRVTNMNTAIGIGRAVMQDEFGPTFAGFANLLVQSVLFPVFQHAGLPLRQVAAHWESRFR